MNFVAVIIFASFNVCRFFIFWLRYKNREKTRFDLAQHADDSHWPAINSDITTIVPHSE